MMIKPVRAAGTASSRLDLGRVAHRSQRDAAKALNVPRSVLQRAGLARKRTRQQASFAPDLRVSVERDSVAF